MENVTKTMLEKMREESPLEAAFCELVYLCEEEKDKSHVESCAYAFITTLTLADIPSALAVLIGIDHATTEQLKILEGMKDGKND